MSENALDTLETLLDEHAVPHGGMSLEMLDGYLSALVVGPRPVAPAVYMAAIWGEAPPPVDPQVAAARFELVIGLWNHIAWRVAQPEPDASEADSDAPDPLMPFMQFPDVDVAESADDDSIPDELRDFPAGAEWAQGFLAAVDLVQPAWNAWLDADEGLSGDFDMLSRLAVYGEEHARDMDLDPSAVPAIEERLAFIGEIPDLLAYCNDRRLGALAPRPAGGTAVPGRNDPCNCGSGREYRLCCGGGVTLH